MMRQVHTKGNAGEIDTYVGKTLFKLRQMAGLSQEDLANASGVSFQQIQKYEKGKNRIAVSRLYDFSKILGVTPNDFFIGYDNFEIQDEVQKKQCDQTTLAGVLEYSPELAKVIKLFSKISKPDQRVSAAKGMIGLLKLFVDKQGE